MNTPLPKFGISQPAARLEDQRLLTGEGRYTDDIAPANAAHMAVVRAQVAHGDIQSIETEDARAMEGVLAVYTAADFEGSMENSMQILPVKNRDGTTGTTPLRPMVACDRVRFLGEAVALVIAETPAQARAAAEMVYVEYEDLPVTLDLEFGGPEIHPEAPENLAYDWAFGDEDATQAAFDAAAHHIKLRVHSNRVICNSMEPRACYAEPEGDRWHVCFSGQGVWGAKRLLAQAFDVDAETSATKPRHPHSAAAL